MLCSYENQVEPAMSSCGQTCTNLAIGSGGNGRTGKFFSPTKSGVGEWGGGGLGVIFARCKVEFKLYLNNL